MNTHLITILLLLVSTTAMNAQVQPITQENHRVRNNYIEYKTATFDQDMLSISNQPVSLKDVLFSSQTKARLDVTKGGFNVNWFLNNLSVNSFKALSDPNVKGSSVQNRLRFYLTYVINQDGIVKSSSASFPNGISLSNAEIETILTESINHRFEYTKKPSHLSSFYYSVIFPITIPKPRISVVLNDLYKEHGRRISSANKTIVYNSLDRIASSLSSAQFNTLNAGYVSATGANLLISSLKSKIGNVTSTDPNYSTVTHFSNWFTSELEKEALAVANIGVRFEGCINNNDCIVKPPIMSNGLVKYSIENNIAIIDNICNILSDLDTDTLSKIAAPYGYPSAGVFKFNMCRDSEDEFTNKQSILSMQNRFKVKILNYIVSKYASSARFEDCENEYYNCDCIRPCPN